MMEIFFLMLLMEITPTRRVVESIMLMFDMYDHFRCCCFLDLGIILKIQEKFCLFFCKNLEKKKLSLEMHARSYTFLAIT